MLTLILGLASCSQTGRQSDSKMTDPTSTQNDGGNNYDQTLKYRDLESDSLSADKIDQLKFAEFSTKGTKIKEKEYGGGDCESKFKRLVLGNDTLTVDKYDCGDYGFGNTEFITSGDSLQYVREYKIEWSPDDKGNQFRASETTYEFSTNRLLKRTRAKFVEKWKDFRITEIPFEGSRLRGQDEYNQFKKELRDILSASQDRTLE